MLVSFLSTTPFQSGFIEFVKERIGGRPVFPELGPHRQDGYSHLWGSGLVAIARSTRTSTACGIPCLPSGDHTQGHGVPLQYPSAAILGTQPTGRSAMTDMEDVSLEKLKEVIVRGGPFHPLPMPDNRKDGSAEMPKFLAF